MQKAKDNPSLFEISRNGPPRSRMEVRIMELSRTIRSKPNWWNKKRNPKIVEKWEAEALAQGMSQQEVDYAIAELEHYDESRDGDMQISVVDGAWMTDDVIPEYLIENLKAGVAKLEDVPDEEKDWHPGSNEQVNYLNLPALIAPTDSRFTSRCWI